VEILQQVLQPPYTLPEKITLETSGQPERDNQWEMFMIETRNTPYMHTDIDQFKHTW